MTTFSFGGHHTYANRFLTDAQLVKCMLIDVQVFMWKENWSASDMGHVIYAVTRPFGGSNSAGLCRYDRSSHKYRLVNIHESFDEVIRIVTNFRDFGLVWEPNYDV